MRPHVLSFLCVSALFLAFLLLSGVETVEGQATKWCNAAIKKNNRINFKFCYDELMIHGKPADREDPWRLAKVSARAGAFNGKSTVNWINILLAKPETDAKIKPALQACIGFYGQVEDTFDNAANKIDSGRNWYAVARTEVAKTASLARQCENAFTAIGVASVLRVGFEYNQQMGYICLALIDIIDK